MAFDVARVRGLFPALSDGWVHLDAPAGMQVPEQVATAVSTALRAPVSGPGGIFPASQRAEAIVDAARRAIADVVGAVPHAVVLGSSSATLLQRLALSLSETWRTGDEIVVSRLDHLTNVTPWVQAAQRSNVVTRWAEIDIETCELPEWQYRELISDRTRLVTVTAGSGAVGTRPDLQKIAEISRQHDTIMVVDASSAAPFVPLNVTTMNADVVAVSANLWGGPPIGALAFRDFALLESLPSCSANPDASGPERLELGPHAYPLLAGLVASVDYLAALDDAAIGPRRERVLTSLGSVKAYQAGLLANLINELRSLRRVMVIGDAMRRIPAIAFTVAEMTSEEVVAHLAEHGVCAFTDSGEHAVFSALGVSEIGGAIRVGLAHYTNASEVEALIDAVAALR